MDHAKVFKQAWHNVWGYRALWVFGVILALTTFSWSAILLLSDNGDENTSRIGITVTMQPGETLLEALQRTVNQEIDEFDIAVDKANREINEFFAKELDVAVESDILAIITVFAAIILFLYILAKIARYVAEASLIRMVDDQEDTGTQLGVRRGLRLGWSRSAWRLFLIDLVINTPVALCFLALFGMAFIPLLLWDSERPATIVFGGIFSAGFLFFVIGLAILVALALSLLKPIMRRECVLQGVGVLESLHNGFGTVRRHLKDAGLTWLIIAGVSVAWPFLMAPIALALLGVGIFLGGGAALATGGLATLAINGAAPWIVAITAGISIFLLTLLAPLVFLGGLREVFVSSAWTLTYRELKPLESREPTRSAGLDSSALGIAQAG